jgi:uncharacterized protein (TIGR01777 family)
VRILMAGASGFLGTRLARRLRESGHQVVRLVRRSPSGADELRWDPAAGDIDPAALPGTDAVINLAGANVADRRWTDKYKQEIRSSRLDTTARLANAIAALPADQRPQVLLNGSAVGYYGDNGDRAVDERTTAGRGFLAELGQQWEAATAPAAKAGTRVVLMRTGLPLDPDGGVLKPLMLPFRLGVGGPIGNGRPYLPWISMPDWLSAVEFLLERSDISGPVNLTGPTPVRSAEFSRALGRQLRRPALIPVPKLAISAILGADFARETLSSLRVLPVVLTDRGFHFAHPTVDDALAVALPR